MVCLNLNFVLLVFFFLLCFNGSSKSLLHNPVASFQIISINLKFVHTI